MVRKRRARQACAGRRGSICRGSPLAAILVFCTSGVTPMINPSDFDGTRILVGDVGGTHARFAIVEVSARGPWRIGREKVLDQGFPTFSAALRSYFEAIGADQMPPIAAIAVAGPVTRGTARFTNRQWQISEKELVAFGFKHALLINDFAALAFAIPILEKKDLRPVGPELEVPELSTVTILGAGTGFGVSCLARYGDQEVPMATEGGHIGFAPSDAAESAVLDTLRKQFGRVSVERILSGPGLESVYRTLEQLSGRVPAPLAAAEIVARASGQDAGCRTAFTLFCAVFGSGAGDFALAHGARGGVYLAGGVVQRNEALLQQSPFRARFESKGRLSPYVAAIPTKLIVQPEAAFLGAARAGVLLARRGGC